VDVAVVGAGRCFLVSPAKCRRITIGPVRLVTAATIVAIALVFRASSALATAAARPQFGVYTANVAIGGVGHLEVSIHVLDPPTKVTLTFACGEPRGRDTVTEVLNSAPVVVRGGAFSLTGTASLSRFTTLTENNALVKRSSVKATVDVRGAFTARGHFVGTALLGGSPCNGTSYTAPRLAGPALQK
jgi:hypothetical protein